MAFGAPSHPLPRRPDLIPARRLQRLEPWILAAGAGGQALVLAFMLRVWQHPLPATHVSLLIATAFALALASLRQGVRLSREAAGLGGAAAAAAGILHRIAPMLASLALICHWWGRCALAALGVSVLTAALGALWPQLPALAPASALIVLLLPLIPGQGPRAALLTCALFGVLLPSAGVLLFDGALPWMPATQIPTGPGEPDLFLWGSAACTALFLLGPSVSVSESVLTLGDGQAHRQGEPRRWAQISLVSLALVLLWTTELFTATALPQGPLATSARDAIAGLLLTASAAALALQLCWRGAFAALSARPEGPVAAGTADRNWRCTVLTSATIFGFFLLRDAPWLFAGAGLAWIVGQVSVAAVTLLPGQRPVRRAGLLGRYAGSRAPALFPALVWLAAALLGLQAWGVQAVLIGLVMVCGGTLLHSALRQPGSELRGRVRPSVHAKLLAGMLLILALNGAGYLIAHQTLQTHDRLLAALVGDIFTTVALLTVLVGLVLPAMIVHALTGAAESAERLAHDAVARLRDGIDALGRGELDTPPIPMHMARLATPFHDEIGRIATSINTLQDDVQQAARGLDLARENLRRSRADLFHQARHDSLTGLHNRRAFEEELARFVGDRRNPGVGHALLYLDLDQFKIVNDTCGHDAGDELLRQVSLLLAGQMRAADILSRLGGDEFGVILADCSRDNALRIGEAMLVAVRELSFGWQDRIFRIGVSIGVVHFLSGSTTLTEVMSAADKACYYAKEQGRNRLHAYSPDDVEISTRSGEMQWVSRIHEALEQGRMCLYAQHIRPIDRDAETHDAGHHELLLRMVDQQEELVPPMAFIPAAERFGVMPLLDRWVVRTALARMAELDQGSDASTVGSLAINLSGASITDESFLEYVKEQFRLSRVPHHRIWFEITETAAIANLKKAKRFIAELRALGCRFGLDDFGAGMSSFGYLRQLEVDFLKIDGAFVQDMAEDPIDHAMVASINRIGQLMGLHTIAEFVEDERTLVLLRELGVNMVQGTGVAAPIPFVRAQRPSRRPDPVLTSTH